MFYLDPQTNNRYRIGTPFDYNGTQYSSAGANHTTFTQLGFTQVIPNTRPDDRFYVVTGPDDTGAYLAVPRDLSELKTRFKDETRRTAWSMLKGTDWYIIRALEEPITYTVDPAVHDFRVGVRAAGDARCAEIDACADIGALKALIDASPQIPSEINPGTFVVNPDALTQFPEIPNTVRSY